MCKALIQAFVIVLFVGTTYTATPTNCKTFPFCGIGGQCIDEADPLFSKCVCYQGYRFNNQNFQCEDINECNVTSAAVCPRGRCLNLDGTYKCICPQGYAPHYPDGKTCERVYQNNGIFGRFNLWQLLLLFGGEL